MSERRSNYRRTLLMSVPLFAVALFGCGSDSDSPSAAEQQRQKMVTESPTIEAEYFANGTRQPSYKNIHHDRPYAHIYQVCDGPDLLEQSDNAYRSGNAIFRTINHPACADGKLAPEDFAIPG